MSPPLSRPSPPEMAKHRRKRIKLFDSANKNGDTKTLTARCIRGIWELTDLELLALREIVVQCSVALGDTEKPNPDVVDKLIGFLFAKGWNSADGPAELDPILYFRELEDIPDASSFSVTEATDEGYMLKMGDCPSEHMPVYGYAAIVGNESSPGGIQFHYKFSRLAMKWPDSIAATNFVWNSDRSDVESWTADSSVCHDQLIVDQLRRHNIQTAIQYGRRMVCKFANGEPVDIKETHEFLSFDASESHHINTHLISNRFPSVLAKSSKKLHRGLDLRFVQTCLSGHTTLSALQVDV